MDVQYPVRSLDQFAGFHELAHCEPLTCIFFSIGQEDHGKAFAEATTCNANIRIFSIGVRGIFVCVETFNRFVTVFTSERESHGAVRREIGSAYSLSLCSNGCAESWGPS